MRICMVAFTHYTSDSRVRREAEALAERGDEVEVIALQETGMAHSELFNGVRIRPVPLGRRRGRRKGAYVGQYFAFFLWAFAVLTWRHVRRPYRVVQVHTMPDFMVFAALVPRLLGAKIILDVHDLMPELYMCKFGVSERHVVIRCLRWVERWSAAFAHQVIAVHIPHRDRLIQQGCSRDRLSVVLNVPDPRIFGSPRLGPRDPDGAFRLIYHGTIAPRHGLQIAIEAVDALRNEIPNLRLSIVGEGDDRERLVQLVRDRGLEKQIGFSCGRVPLDSLPDMIRQADVGLVPILYDPFTRYMLPVKMLEYIGLGIPVIVSRTETIEHYCSKETVRYCEPGNVADWAQGILELYRMPDLREALVRNGDDFRRSMSWHTEKHTYLDLVQSLA